MTTYNVVSSGAMVAGQPEDISVVLANFNAIATVLNGNIDNANVNAAAAIAYSKLALGNSIVNADIAGAAAILSTKLAGLGISMNPVVISATPTDIALSNLGSINSMLRIGTGGGTLRSISTPNSVGTIVMIQNASGANITLKHNLAGSPGGRSPLYIDPGSADMVLANGQTVIGNFEGSFWLITGFTVPASPWIAFNPTWTASGAAPALGNASQNWKYQQIGKTVFVNGYTIFGSTSTFGGGVYYLGFPVPAIGSNNVNIGSCRLYDQSAGSEWSGTVVTDAGAGLKAEFHFTAPAGGYTVGAITPFTWAVNDVIFASYTYEAA